MPLTTPVTTRPSFAPDWQSLARLDGVDILVIAIYFGIVIFIGFYLKGSSNTSEDFFMAGREMTAWIAGLSFVSANLGSLELMGWAGVGLSVRHSCNALVLDRRHSGDAVPRHRHDAVLLHLENPLRARATCNCALASQPRAFRDLLRLHDRADERHQHVLDGAGHEGRSRAGISTSASGSRRSPSRSMLRSADCARRSSTRSCSSS